MIEESRFDPLEKEIRQIKAEQCRQTEMLKLILEAVIEPGQADKLSVVLGTPTPVVPAVNPTIKKETK